MEITAAIRITCIIDICLNWCEHYYLFVYLVCFFFSLCNRFLVSFSMNYSIYFPFFRYDWMHVLQSIHPIKMWYSVQWLDCVLKHISHPTVCQIGSCVSIHLIIQLQSSILHIVDSVEKNWRSEFSVRNRVNESSVLYSS